MRASRLPALVLSGVFLLSACGAKEAEGAPDAPGTAPAPAGAPDETAQRPAGLPPDAVAIETADGQTLWVQPRPGGRVLVYQFRDDGTVEGVGGPVEEMAALYPDADFSAFETGEGQDDGGAAGGGLDPLRASQERLVEITPGAAEALEVARRGTVIELTGPTLTHMIESMGGSLDVTSEDLERLLASTDGRITATQAELRALIKQAGGDPIREAALAALIARTLEEPPPKLEKDAATRGRTHKDCPGLVYGTGEREICLPLGALSFADAAVSFTPGEKPSKAPFDFPGNALGEPDYRNTRSADFISLGCQGVLVLQFLDNALIDVDGVDLYVFEIGPFVERTELAISSDGARWIDVGVIEGARSEVDISDHVARGERFSYVRLTNAGKSCGGNHSGADIDAVAAVGAEIRLSLDSALLFDVGKSEIKPEAASALEALASQIKAYGRDIRITVEGHTDSTGSDRANLTLSEARARSVWNDLAPRLGLPDAAAAVRGFGEARPVAENDTEEGRAKNRRVDLLILPGSSGVLKEE